jgi:hypothetical protein
MGTIEKFVLKELSVDKPIILQGHVESVSVNKDGVVEAHLKFGSVFSGIYVKGTDLKPGEFVVAEIRRK